MNLKSIVNAWAIANLAALPLVLYTMAWQLEWSPLVGCLWGLSYLGSFVALSSMGGIDV